MLVLPSRDPPLWASRAFAFERAALARGCPVAPQHLAGLLVRVAIWQPLASWAAIGILLGQIHEVLLAEAPLRFGPRGQRLRQRHRDARFVAFKNLWAAEVSTIDNSLECLSLQDRLRLLGNISKLRPIRAAVRYLMGHNQMMFGVDCHLNIVANDTGAAAAGCHRTAVRVGQRDLLIGRSKHLLLVPRKLPHLLLQLR